MILKAIQNCETHSFPWGYITMKDALTKGQIAEIKNASITTEGKLNDGTRSGYKKGVEKQNHKFREYVTKENSHRYPQLTQLIYQLQSKKVRSEIFKKVFSPYEEFMPVKNFEGSYVRLEVLNDPKGFWLKPHLDIEEKLISSLIYINDTDENKNLGTDLYNEELEYMSTVPFEHNYGYIFSEHAAKGKWHGMEKDKVVKTERRGIQLNYVTFKTDWPV